MRRTARNLGISLAVGGLLYGVIATAREVLSVGGHGALVFDGDRIGTDLVAQGAAISAAGLLLILFSRPRTQALRARYVLPVSIGLVWTSFGTIHAVLELFDVRIANPIARSIIVAYFTPIRVAQRMVGEILLVTSADRLFWYLPTLGILFGFASTLLVWTLLEAGFHRWRGGTAG